MTPTAMGTTAAGFRRVRLPLVSYYAVTVLVPLANGSGNTGRVFLEHMTFVLVAPPTLIALVALFSHAWQKAVLTFAARLERARNMESVAMPNGPLRCPRYPP